MTYFYDSGYNGSLSLMGVIMCEVAGLRIGFYSHQISERVQTVAYETAKKVVHLADRLFEVRP